jgi:hypothetical protein
MAASTTSGFSLRIPSPARALPAVARYVSRPRRITPEAGHALEILGHAIEYLSDEFVYHGGEMTEHNPEVEAVRLLMALNRAIYLSCPEVRTWGERLRALVNRWVR